MPSPFKEWTLFARPPSIQYGLNFKLRTTPQLVVPPFSMAKTFCAPPPPIFMGVKLHMSPAPVLLPPPPVISDQSLIYVLVLTCNNRKGFRLPPRAWLTSLPMESNWRVPSIYTGRPFQVAFTMKEPRCSSLYSSSRRRASSFSMKSPSYSRTNSPLKEKL